MKNYSAIIIFPPRHSLSLMDLKNFEEIFLSLPSNYIVVGSYLSWAKTRMELENTWALDYKTKLEVLN